jgi:hypothetical protein
MRPVFRFAGGIAVFIIDGLLQFSTHYQTFAFIQISFPGLYTFLTSRPVALCLLLVAVGFIASGCIGIWKTRRVPITENRGPAIRRPQEIIAQEIRDSNAGGDIRMVGKVERDYIEKQETHIHHHDRLSEAQLEEFRQIDDFLVKKTEMQLRETFDFPEMLKFNIRLARNFYWPRSVPPREQEEMAEFFKGGDAIMYKPFLDMHTAGDGLYMKGKPGKLYFSNTSKKCLDAKAILRSFFSSSTLPSSVVDALNDVSRAVESNIEMFPISLSESYALNQRNIRENDDPGSDRHSAAWNYYCGRFVHLKPKADAVGMAIRSVLKTNDTRPQHSRAAEQD